MTREIEERLKDALVAAAELATRRQDDAVGQAAATPQGHLNLADRTPRRRARAWLAPAVAAAVVVAVVLAASVLLHRTPQRPNQLSAPGAAASPRHALTLDSRSQAAVLDVVTGRVLRRFPGTYRAVAVSTASLYFASVQGCTTTLLVVRQPLQGDRWSDPEALRSEAWPALTLTASAADSRLAVAVDLHNGCPLPASTVVLVPVAVGPGAPVTGLPSGADVAGLLAWRGDELWLRSGQDPVLWSVAPGATAARRTAVTTDLRSRSPSDGVVDAIGWTSGGVLLAAVEGGGQGSVDRLLHGQSEYRISEIDPTDGHVAGTFGLPNRRGWESFSVSHAGASVLARVGERLEVVTRGSVREVPDGAGDAITAFW